MNKTQRVLGFLFGMLFLFGIGINASARSVVLKFATQSTNGQYAPQHVLAVWVEDAEGNFVKSMKVMATRYGRYLTSWRYASGDNMVDAVTGPTLMSHQDHSIEWDCTDKDGNVVPEGDYKFVIEFTEINGEGPIYSLDFKVSSEGMEITPEDKQYFKNVALSVVPE